MAPKIDVEANMHHEKGFLNQEQADSYYARLDSGLPWGNFSWAPGEKPLKQLVYAYDLEERNLRKNPILEELIHMVETKYNTKSVITWCNKFRSSSDKIDWHQDQYGMSLFVLSFGANRPVEIRPYKNPWLSTKGMDRPATHKLDLKHGDLYHWTAEFDEKMEHRVPPAEVDGPRISILILGHPINSNNDPAQLQKRTMSPFYTGQCTKCKGFLKEIKMTLTDAERKCKSCGKKYYYGSWDYYLKGN